MKFVYFGYDFMLASVQRLLDDGHELLGIFTFQCDNIFNFNVETAALGKKLGVPVIYSRPEDTHLDEFIDQGCEVFIAAGYPFKIPPPDENKAYAINLHPSLLPMGRGLMPTPTILIDAPEAAGVSVHKLTEDFDKGDVLFQESLPLSPDETVDKYAGRIATRGPDILSVILAELPKHWSEATAQDENRASTFPTPDDEMRTFQWSDSLERIDKIARAFGRFGCLCEVQNTQLAVYELETAENDHDLPPGHVIEHTDSSLSVAALGGIVTLKKFEGL